MTDLQKEPCWICRRTLEDIKKEVPELELDTQDENEQMTDPSIKWFFAVCPVCAELIESVASKWHIDDQYIEEWFMPKFIHYLNNKTKIQFTET